ncbi:MAG: prepilin-type N-terminal cleavage/methylation domain-containing protein [Patescibacteria group bacterium]
MRYKNLFSSSQPGATQSRGFGLVELMVSISIMTLVSTVILVKNRSFNNALLLRNQAYEIAFSLRQAQLMAVSGNRPTATSRNTYGIHLDVSGTVGDTHRQYRMFRDDVSNLNWYDAGDATIGSVGTIDSKYIIDIADSSGNAIAANTLSITFVRPNFDALFKTSSGGAISSAPVYLKIMPRDSTGYANVPYRLIEITSTGQISVI